MLQLLDVIPCAKFARIFVHTCEVSMAEVRAEVHMPGDSG
jgi:hypothetical protein